MAKANHTAFFLDRDGVIIEETNFLSDPSRLRLIHGSGRAISLLNSNNIKVVVVTNQSGVARGFFDEATVSRIHDALDRILEREGARVDRYYYCPHHPTEGKGAYLKDCPNRKPNPGMILKAKDELGIDLHASFMVGDKISDLLAGKRAGLKLVLVNTGYGKHITEKELAEHGIRLYCRAENLEDAVEFCVARENTEKQGNED